MSIENREQQVDQLLRGIYRMCVNRDDCRDCPFYITKCTFGEPRPSTWFDEETIGNKFSPNYLKFTDKDIVIKAKEEASEPAQEDAQAASQAEAKAEAQSRNRKKLQLHGLLFSPLPNQHLLQIHSPHRRPYSSLSYSRP